MIEMILVIFIAASVFIGGVFIAFYAPCDPKISHCQNAPTESKETRP